MDLPRLRQVALAVRELQPVAGALGEAFGWTEPFQDPGVGEFGLQNAVFTAGDTFVEVVSPVREGTTAGRYLERRGGDTGYMAIFQVADVRAARERVAAAGIRVADVRAARERVAAAGIRVVWQADLADVAGTHLHPRDVPGAIVSIDWADPPGSWRWAGPAWTGAAAPHSPGGVSAISVEVKEPLAAARRWAAALGVEADGEGDGAAIRLVNAGQVLRFASLRTGPAEGITEVTLAGTGRTGTHDIGGVRFVAT